jgi:precorrin-6B methylase 2
MNFIKSIAFRGMFGICDFCAELALRGRPCTEIKSGPFAGMRYGSKAVGSSLTPKLLGTYEKELAGTIGQLPVFDIAIDVGAAEGWYAVGLLYRKKARSVVAFELGEEGRKICRENAERNGVAAQIEIRGGCAAADFQTLLRACRDKGQRVLIISDCEGFEKELFSAETVKLCGHAWLIIETHELQAPGVREYLAQNLEASHAVTHIQRARRTRDDIQLPPCGWLPWLLKLPFLHRFVMSERRGPGNEWLVAIPKTAE